MTAKTVTLMRKRKQSWLVNLTRGFGRKTLPPTSGRNCMIRRKRIAEGLGGCLLLFSVFAPLSSPVKGQCPQGWNVGTSWGLKQSNQEEPNHMILGVEFRERRISTEGFYHYYRFSGTASYGRDVSGQTSTTGTVKGNVSGNDINLEISWSNGLTGIYNGKIGPRGRIAGTGYEKRTPSKKVSWFSDTAMICEQATKQRHIRAGDFVIVKRLPPSFPLPNNVKIPDPIGDDVTVGQKYQTTEYNGGEVTILTPLGKRKEYRLPESCVELAPR
jgi:hypothetical protein